MLNTIGEYVRTNFSNAEYTEFGSRVEKLKYDIAKSKCLKELISSHS